MLKEIAQFCLELDSRMKYLTKKTVTYTHPGSQNNMADVNSIQIIHNELIAEIKEPSFYIVPD